MMITNLNLASFFDTLLSDPSSLDLVIAEAITYWAETRDQARLSVYP